MMDQSILARSRRFAADALGMYLLPGFVAVLPWRLGFGLLKRCARNERLYQEAADPAWVAAREHCPDSDEKTFKYRFRLLRLVDHTDVYLTLLRGKRWRQRNITALGDWPQAGACVFLTYHWGAGNWVWPLLRERGFAAYFLAQRPQGRSLGLTRLSHWFGSLRGWALRRIGSRGALFTGDSAETVIAALRRGESVVGMLDLPARAQQSAAQFSLLDGEVRFPLGLARLGTELPVAIALFSFGLDFSTGRRELRIEKLDANLSPQEVLRRYVAHLDGRLRAAPEAWQIWREASAMFVANAD
jgi:phosphatidylinositol dimannoside acyltransferase